MLQQSDESIDSFVSRLRGQAIKCNFVYTVEYTVGTGDDITTNSVKKDISDEMIRDRIVVAIHDETTRSRLLREPKLTLQSAIDMIRTVEVADEYVQRIKDSKPVDAVTSFKNKRKKQNSGHKPQQVKNSNCNKCGTKHEKKNCPAFGKTCYKCNKPNHYASQCKAKSVNAMDRSDCNTPDSFHAVDNGSCYVGDNFFMSLIDVLPNVNKPDLEMDVFDV